MRNHLSVFLFFVFVGLSVNGKAQNPGEIDLSFDPGTGGDGTVYTTAIQPDGKVIISGEFISYDGTAMNRIARLNEDGTLDGSFTVGTGANGIVRTAAIQSDGKIIIGGGFTSYNGTVTNRVARLNADGSLDDSFTVGTGPTSGGFFVSVNTTAIQPDGKIIIAGSFTSFDGTSMRCIARLNADGTLDGSFTVGTGATGGTGFSSAAIHTTAVQTDGKIIIGGNFSTYNGTARNYIARLNPDGTLDGSFTVGTGASGPVYTANVQTDGRVIIGGDFISYDGVTFNNIARLNADGTLDSSFSFGTGANDIVNTCIVQPDGRIIFGGQFTFFNGSTGNRIARLNPDGTLDNSFLVGIGANGSINTIAIQPDKKIIIGGGLTTYEGAARDRVARLHGACTASSVSIITEESCAPIIAADGRVLGTSGQHTVVTGCDSTIINLTILGPETVSFDDWLQVGEPINGRWLSQSNGRMIRQTVNSNPTFLITSNDLINVRVKGRLWTNDNDDDFIGLVMGHKLPTDATTTYDTWLFDWKKDDQSNGGFMGFEGFAFSRVLGDIANNNAGLQPTFWGHTTTPEFTVVATDYGPEKGFERFVKYEFEVLYTYFRTVIIIDGDTIFDINDDFEEGRFGFYNYSQPDVFFENLTVQSLTEVTEEVCETYTSPANEILTASGQYLFNVQDENGCDSTVVVDLTVNAPTISAITASTCDSYSAPDGQVYTEDGQFTAIIPNANGCDSTITISLTVGQTVSITEEQTICEGGSFVMPDGSTATEGGTYTFSGLTESGCDSTYVVELTVDICIGMETTSSTDFDLFPNPGNGLFTLVTSGEGLVRLTVKDISGREVMNESFTTTSGTARSIDLSGEANGIYTLRIETEKGTSGVKLVKE